APAGGPPRHGRGDHGRVRHLPHARTRGRLPRPPLAHLRRLDPGGCRRSARRALLRGALDAPPRGRREIRVRARGVRPAGGLRRGVGRSARHLSRRNRGDRGRGGRVRRAAGGARARERALGGGRARGAVHGREPRGRRFGTVGAEPRDPREGARARGCRRRGVRRGRQVLPIERIAGSNLVPGDVAAAVSGAGGGALVAALALLVVVASLNGNLFVTPRVIFGMAREGLAPAVLARVNRGGTPWAATLLVGAVVVLLAATGTFQSLLGLAVTVIIVIDGFTVLSLFRLRARRPSAPFLVPLFPLVPLLFVGVYAALF